MDLEEAFRVVGEFGSYQKQAVAAIVVTQVGVCVLAVLLRILTVHLVTPQPTKKNVATWLLAELLISPGGSKEFCSLNLFLIIDQTVGRKHVVKQI